MLKKQPGFVLKKIKDSYYLLPFGQQVADQKRDCFSMKQVLFCGNVSVIPQSMQSL